MLFKRAPTKAVYLREVLPFPRANKIIPVHIKRRKRGRRSHPAQFLFLFCTEENQKFCSFVFNFWVLMKHIVKKVLWPFVGAPDQSTYVCWKALTFYSAEHIGSLSFHSVFIHGVKVKPIMIAIKSVFNFFKTSTICFFIEEEGLYKWMSENNS